MTCSLRGLRTCPLVEIQIIKFGARSVVNCSYLVAASAACLAGKLIGERTVHDVLRCRLLNSFMKLLLTVVGHKVTQTVNFV